MTKQKHPEAQFLHEKYPNLQKSEEVEYIVEHLRANGEEIPGQPADKISAYLGFLANTDYVNDGILTGDPESISRQIDLCVIKAEDVPESYFELQQRIAREQGHGDVAITEQVRRQMIEAIQADQRASLAQWAEYVAGDGNYPDWFRYYAWESVTKLGKFDKEKHEFQKRSRGTTVPYPELNREALAYVLDKLNKHRLGAEPTDDETLAGLVAGGNFGKLYAHAVMEVTPSDPELLKNIDGEWVRFDQTTDPRVARRLSESLQGHGTGWCTAGESTATSQLRGGDFYVFYSKDSKDKYTVPRLAIRMEDGKVSYDVRGILPGQEVELELIDTLAEKLDTLPGGKEYSQKAADMKRLTAIEKLLKADPNSALSKEDVKFLYELDHNIEGFGYQRGDPRIKELQVKRGELDYEMLRVLAVEHLRDSFEASYQGYTTVASQINARRAESEQIAVLTEKQIEQLFDAKMSQWQSNGVLDYVAERIISHGELHTPIMRPNVVVTTDELKALANNFATGQGFDKAYIYDNLYDSYDESDYATLSGYQPGAGEAIISLLPSKSTDELGVIALAERQEALRRMQLAAPELNLRSPSVFDGIVLWNTLRAGGDRLDGSGARDRTCIRQLDIEPKGVRGVLLVPVVVVFDGGRPVLGNSDADDARGARVSLG